MAEKLGVSMDVTVEANLYKLLPYETGGHFEAHQDTEKEEGMFGTLVVQVPSTFTGGYVTVTLAPRAQFRAAKIATRTSRHGILRGLFARTGSREVRLSHVPRLNLVVTNACYGPAPRADNFEKGTIYKLRVAYADWKAQGATSLTRVAFALEHVYPPKV